MKREDVEKDFLAWCKERQDIYCTHGYEGGRVRFDRCRQCVIEEAVNQIHALRHDLERALSNHSLDLSPPQSRQSEE